MQREPGRTAGHPIRSHQQAGGLGAFDHPLQPQPGRERQPADGVGGRFARVERDQAELAGLQHERECPDGLHQRALIEIAAQPGVRHHEAADPEQPIQIDPGRRPPIPRRTCRAHRPARRARRAVVAAASIWNNRLVRPDDRGPTSSETCPRGTPPCSRASKAACPVEAYSSPRTRTLGKRPIELFRMEE